MSDFLFAKPEERHVSESTYQRYLKDILQQMLPGCVVLKNDPHGIQGFPDLLILYRDRWAALEVKVSATARPRPNQEYYVDRLHEMSYASFIFPENEGPVLHALQQALTSGR